MENTLRPTLIQDSQNGLDRLALEYSCDTTFWLYLCDLRSLLLHSLKTDAVCGFCGSKRLPSIREAKNANGAF